MASTIHGGVNTSPWSATRCLDFTRLMNSVPLIACRHSHTSERPRWLSRTREEGIQPVPLFVQAPKRLLCFRQAQLKLQEILSAQRTSGGDPEAILDEPASQ